jgi:hypothetical protein
VFPSHSCFGLAVFQAASPPVLVPAWGPFGSFTGLSGRRRVALEGVYWLIRLRHPFEGNLPAGLCGLLYWGGWSLLSGAVSTVPGGWRLFALR